MRVLNPKWMDKMDEKIAQGRVDEILTSSISFNWLVARLAKAGKPYRIHKLGGSVKRITSDAEVCPCCKQKLLK